MRILVTGASGFLGRHVVDALLRAGHGVRAVLRTSTRREQPEISAPVEIFRADLCTHPDMSPAFEGIDVLVHLAAVMSGTLETRFVETVNATERLLEAMSRSTTRRLILCSSFSVYDWQQAGDSVDEDQPVSSMVDPSGGYAAAKRRQEQLASSMSREQGWKLTVLRPGFIWGPRNECPGGSVGFDIGRIHVVIGCRRHPPLTHVANCSDCFRAAVEDPRAEGQIFNVVDGHDVTAWRFAGEYLRHGATSGFRLPLPYGIAFAGMTLVDVFVRCFPRLAPFRPDLLSPAEFAERCRPRCYDTRRLREVLGWQAPLDFEQCLQQTYTFAKGQSPT